MELWKGRGFSRTRQEGSMKAKSKTASVTGMVSTSIEMAISTLGHGLRMNRTVKDSSSTRLILIIKVISIMDSS